MVNVITEPTRITKGTETLIDHIYTTSVEHGSSSSPTPIGISDHCLPFIIRKHLGAPSSKGLHSSVKFKHVQTDQFLADLYSAP